MTIALVWVISATIGSPIVLGLNNTPDRVEDACLFYNSDFIIYSSLSSFYIPCIIMVFLYYNIFKVSLRAQPPTTEQTIVKQTNACITLLGVIIQRLDLLLYIVLERSVRRAVAKVFVPNRICNIVANRIIGIS